MQNQENIFHLGLCMAGSVSAGAYTAGVIDYLMEALQAWEEAKSKGESGIPDHQVVIDLIGGASGGAITAAIAAFALHDQQGHIRLDKDRRSILGDKNENIFWKTWVELIGQNVLQSMLDTSDLNRDGFVPSAFNTRFIDELAESFKIYIDELAASGKAKVPAYLCDKTEIFLTLFNVTGIKYSLAAKAEGGAKIQFVSEHRDIAHFRWGPNYEGDGRMELSLDNDANRSVLIESAKATGAFPVGLKGRIVNRKAKYIWDNPFFTKNGRFGPKTIQLAGIQSENGDEIYSSLNADGGTANNEPIEFSRDLMFNMRVKHYGDLQTDDGLFEEMNDTARMAEKRKLHNSSVILIDPFPSMDFELEKPRPGQTENLVHYLPELVSAMRAQLLFDAKDALDAYSKENYGLSIIAPSRKNIKKPEHAIACGALAGFGGFLDKEYRIHDFFLGRRNCQSFIRKYFVVDLNVERMRADGTNNDDFDCVSAVVEAYRRNPEAIRRFGFADNGKQWVPILPDVTLVRPIDKDETGNTVSIDHTPDEFPEYNMRLPSVEDLSSQREEIKKRIRRLITHLRKSNAFQEVLEQLLAYAVDDRLADIALDYLIKDLKERKLIRV